MSEVEFELLLDAVQTAIAPDFEEEIYGPIIAASPTGAARRQ